MTVKDALIDPNLTIKRPNRPGDKHKSVGYVELNQITSEDNDRLRKIHFDYSARPICKLYEPNKPYQPHKTFSKSIFESVQFPPANYAEG